MIYGIVFWMSVAFVLAYDLEKVTTDFEEYNGSFLYSVSFPRLCICMFPKTSCIEIVPSRLGREWISRGALRARRHP